MNARKLSWAACIVALAASANLSADVPVTLTVGATAHALDGAYEVDDATLPTWAIEYRPVERFGAEFSYSRGDTGGNQGFEADIEQWRFDGLFYLRPRDGVHPYLSFGAGRTEREWDRPGPTDGRGGDDIDEQLNLGAGFRYFISDHWSVRADGRWLHGVSEGRDDFGITLGLSYSFAPPRSPEPPPPEPMLEPVPVDSDGDGVFDDSDDCPNTPPGTEVDSRGCKLQKMRIASITLKVNFAFDSSVVEHYDFEDIGSLALFLKRFEEVDVEIEGHTDSTGTDEYNQGLSERRANAVVAILRDEHGIAPDRFMPQGYGESSPIASNDTREGRAENRRVVANLEVEYLE